MIKILVVDDERDICDFLKVFFEQRGHRVFTVTNSLEALPIIEEEKPHLAILDIVMPQMNGIELLREIKERNKEIKVIMLSVVEEEGKKEEAFKAGAYEYITKPFDTSYLESVVMKKIVDLLSLPKKGE